MTNEKFKLLASHIFETVEEDDFLICQINDYATIVLSNDKNMHDEFLRYYANRSLLEIMLELKLPFQAIREYMAIGELLRKALRN